MKFNIQIIDRTEVIDIITSRVEDKIIALGLICIERDKVENKNYGVMAIEADYIVYGTGGPAALYRDSVYPQSQLGSTGMPLLRGAYAQNLTEVQFGIASIGFRWNLSGSYQQVLPRFYSTEPDGSDEVEFLQTFFPDAKSMLEAQFLKGYQWPFDVKKVADFGSSCIDLLVFYERTIRKRRVFMDFRTNPSYPDHEFSVSQLPELASNYLKKSNATGETPVERLKQMNFPAYEIYSDNGIDLKNGPLEIAVCHQHCNGGLHGSIWWESNVENLYPIGECNGTHGVYRPGGSALNSGQVGAIRAAQSIAHKTEFYNTKKNRDLDFIKNQVEEKIKFISDLFKKEKLVNLSEERTKIQLRMSASVGVVRSESETLHALNQHLEQKNVFENSGIEKRKHILFYLKNLDLFYAERLFLESSSEVMKKLKGSRGSYLNCDIEDLFEKDRNSLCAGLNNVVVDDSLNNQVVMSCYDESYNPQIWLEDVRPVPEPETWFEKVWSDFLTGKIYEE